MFILQVFTVFDRSTCSKRSKESLCLKLSFRRFAQILEYFIMFSFRVLTCLRIVNQFVSYWFWTRLDHSIANSSLFPTSLYLHSNSTQILALKKNGFSEKKNFPPPQKIFFFHLFSMQLFSADAMVFSKKFKKIFLTPKKWKNGPQKLLIIGPDPFISQSSPDHSPQPRIDFSYYEISGPDICSLICATIMVSVVCKI